MTRLAIFTPLLLATAAYCQTAPAPVPREAATPIDLPKLTFTFENASLDVVTEGLTHSMGVPIKTWQGGRTGETFSLVAKDQPFWDVYAALSKQHPVVPRDSGGFSIAAQGWGIQSYTTSGGLIFLVTGLSRMHNINLQEAPGNQVEAEKFTMDVAYAADPRMVVLQHAAPHFTQVLDDAGHNLVKPQDADTLSNCDPTRAAIWDHSYALDGSKGVGKKIVSAKGEARFLVQTDETRLDIADPATVLNTELPAGTRKFAFTSFKINANATGLQFDYTLSPSPVADKAQKPDKAHPAPTGTIRLYITDTNNRPVWQGALTSTISSISTTGAFTLPLKAQLRVTRKSEEVAAPFELKDIPLPQ